jgi:UDP-N-acetylglucosamine--N-acetylmuramyl-(pentapeptide) pyrophosphoryl-undecaprenol N-acetylglucosamine transferase
MRILLAGGGTAGHTSPLLATADALRRLEPAAEITCLGTPRGLENRVVPEAGYPLELIPPVPLPRKPSVELLRVPGRLRGAVREARAVLDRIRPDVLVGYGGYVSVPAYLAARRAGVPVVVHEQNSRPGLANKVGARIAKRVAVSFPDTPLRHAEYVGLPIRTMISRVDRRALRAEARAFFGLDPGLPTLVVTGGSQGARNVNTAVSGAARALGEAGVQVLHVVGPKNDVVSHDGALRGSQARTSGGLPPYVRVGFVDRMDYALAAADLMVCRGGASSVTEAAAVGVPAIFVPLPIGNGEQELNPRPVVDAGGALLVKDADFTATWVTEHVPALIADTDRLAAMGAAASGVIPRDADEKLARIVLETAR